MKSETIKLKDKRDFARYMLKGKFVNCFSLAGKWAPEALTAAREGLSPRLKELPDHTMSCSSEVEKKMDLALAIIVEGHLLRQCGGIP